jgi:hypothetical protein
MNGIILEPFKSLCHWSANSDLKFFPLSAQSYKRITEAGLGCEDHL